MEPALLGVSIDKLSTEEWWEASSLVDIGLATTRHDRGQHLWAYCSATEAKLQDVRTLAVAVDDSRVGRKAWKLVAAMLPEENYAMWLPPQDPGATTMSILENRVLNDKFGLVSDLVNQVRGFSKPGPRSVLITMVFLAI